MSTSLNHNSIINPLRVTQSNKRCTAPDGCRVSFKPLRFEVHVRLGGFGSNGASAPHPSRPDQ
jgi:hypothetical protein